MSVQLATPQNEFIGRFSVVVAGKATFRAFQSQMLQRDSWAGFVGRTGIIVPGAVSTTWSQAILAMSVY
jgi:hypothetical protein